MKDALYSNKDELTDKTIDLWSKQKGKKSLFGNISDLIQTPLI